MALENWLPLSLREVKQKGWNSIDVVLFTGDAYIDHPAFGTAVIGRIMETEGLKVAIVAQPNWHDDLRDFKKFGRPNLFFAVTAGNMDSMVNHYTANRRRRSNDAYTPGGKAGFRPDYATTTYTRILKKLYPETPVIIGGVEASLRRFTHYDYWSNQLKPSILCESGADLLVYGMAEKTIKQICRLMLKNVPLKNMATIPQVATLHSKENIPVNKNVTDKWLHSHEQCLASKKKFAENFRIIETESNKLNSARIIQPVEEKLLVVSPPASLMSEKEMDAVWELPFTRLPHPKYQKKSTIPAYEMIRHSVNAHRGCFGGCSFCTISAHQGKYVVSRSEKSILNELEQITKMPDFKGYVTDIGGPSANMYKMHGKKTELCQQCSRPSCIYPSICTNLNIDHQPLINLYQKACQLENIKKITIGSGIRYDMFFDKQGHMTIDGKKYAKQIIQFHISGRLKVAPEHTEPHVLKKMRKTGFESFRKFQQFFQSENYKHKLKQQLVPYFISGHPGCTWEDMANLAIKAEQTKLFAEPVQDFTPTPMTLATVMFYAGIDPYSGEQVEVAKSDKEKKLQKSFFFYRKPKERQKIIKFLHQYKRKDMVNVLYGKQAIRNPKKR